MSRNIKRTKVAVAMSGGVDSSVTVLLLKRKGYRVIGLTMSLLPCGREKIDGCCGLEAIESARRVAHQLNIPHYVLNFRRQFQEKIIQPFCQEYLNGRTPNPCIECNRYIKFNLLLQRVKELGVDFLATGHYARKSEVKNHKIIYQLLRGKDIQKDQSYFLYRLTQKQLKYLIFPLGDLTKKQVRQIAQKNNLPTAKRPESQEICFIPNNDYRKFITRTYADETRTYAEKTIKPGLILDKSGKILGGHQGIAFYTVGQRKGLGIASHEPLYVIKINPLKNILVVGPKKDLFQKELVVKNLSWIAKPPKLPIKTTAKIRYQHPGAKATISRRDSMIACRFLKPQMAITPGQSVVFYRKNLVLGGGTIA